MSDLVISGSAAAAATAGTGSLEHADRLTAHDAQERLLDYLGTTREQLSLQTVRRSILDALRELTRMHRWTYWYTFGRLNLDGSYQTGTIAYDHTGGVYERQVTLSSGTWPTWADRGLLRISGTGVSTGGSVVYPIDRRISDTVVTLDETFNPGGDIAAGTSFTLGREAYTLPADWVAGDNGLIEDNWGGMVYVRPQELLNRQRYVHDSFGQPIYYTYTGDPKIAGRFAVRISPPADNDQTLDYLYLRKPRAIATWDSGTEITPAAKATVDAANFPRKITLAGGTFKNEMVGDVIRLSTSSTAAPTELAGENPYDVERTIRVFVSSTEVEVDQDIQDSYTNVAYRISSPIDVEDLMLNAFLRSTERQSAIARIMRNKREADEEFLRALRFAMEADEKVLAMRTAGLARPYRQRLADMPRGPDIS